jgi:hypothetical protein
MCLPRDDWITQTFYGHITEYYLALKGMKFWCMLQYEWTLLN